MTAFSRIFSHVSRNVGRFSRNVIKLAESFLKAAVFSIPIVLYTSFKTIDSLFFIVLLKFFQDFLISSNNFLMASSNFFQGQRGRVADPFFIVLYTSFKPTPLFFILLLKIFRIFSSSAVTLSSPAVTFLKTSSKFTPKKNLRLNF